MLRTAYIVLFLFFSLNVLAWVVVKEHQARWLNVPSPPSTQSLIAGSLGDSELAYRLSGYFLQNLGDHGGAIRNINEYDFNTLQDWFYRADSLNQKSNYVPALAAGYFGITREPSNIEPVAEYLADIGMRPYGDKWRWLVWAIMHEKNELQNTDKSLELSYMLEAREYENKPAWAYRLSPVILAETGRDIDAYIRARHVRRLYAQNLNHKEKEFLYNFICGRYEQFSQAEPACLLQDE